MKWFNNLRVAYKVLISCAVLISLILLIAFQGINAVRTDKKSFATFYNDRFVPITQLDAIIRSLMQIRVNMLQEFLYAGKGDWNTVKERREATKQLVNVYSAKWRDFYATNMSVEGKRVADQWVEQSKAPAEKRKVFAEAIDAKDLGRAWPALLEWRAAFEALKGTTDKLIEIQQTEGLALMREQEAQADRTTYLSVLYLLLAVIAGAIITFILARAITGPVRRGLDFAQKIAAGDFTTRVEIDQKDELGMLAGALNTSADNLEKMISEIIAAAQNLVQAVQEISSGNENLSQRTSEQASSLEEIASTLEESTASTNQNAENAIQANKTAGEAVAMADDGGKVVAESVTSINDMNQASKRIAEIISVINEIAFQTNLLALNAAVEAARAGEQGRGFAVVAGEVRNLAQRAGNAAKEIGQLITDSVDKTDRATTLVNRSGEALKEIIKASKNVGAIVSEIAAASEEQRNGINQINIAVTELDNMTQQNSALVEETASASEEMASQAQAMLEMMEKFKISEDVRTSVSKEHHREIHLHSVEGARKAKVAVQKKDTGSGRGQVSGAPKGNGKQDIKTSMEEQGFVEF